MFIEIQNVLTADEVNHCRHVLRSSSWQDGRVTAGDQATQTKHNLQMASDSEEAQALGEIILNALGRNDTYCSAALPLRVIPPTFSRYDAGMTFGRHVDNSIRTVPGTGGARMRTDVSSTLMLCAPDEYEGGELVVYDAHGTHIIKPAQGSMVVYPSSSLHEVKAVTRGTRWASVFWAQSIVKDDSQRTQLYELDRAIISIRKQLGDLDDAVLSLVNHYHNLLRRWGEL